MPYLWCRACDKTGEVCEKCGLCSACHDHAMVVQPAPAGDVKGAR